ncbi:MAG: hypothetical protein ACTSUJ_07725 [Candidatus Njordarchaeales archaeon]
MVKVKISLPETLVRKIAEHGLDIESVIIEYLIRRLELNPDEELMIHAELAEKVFLMRRKNLSRRIQYRHRRNCTKL